MMFESLQQGDLGTSAAEYYDRLAERFDTTVKQEDVQLTGEVSILSRHRCRSKGVLVELLDLQSKSRFELEIGVEGLQVAVVLDSVGGHLTATSAGSARCVENDLLGAMPVITGTPNLPAGLVGNNIASTVWLVLTFDAETELVDLGVDLSRLLPGIRTASPRLVSMLKLLGQSLRIGGDHNADKLIADIMADIAHAPAAAGAGGLAPWQLGKVRKYLHDNLSGSVLLRELAAEIRLSQSHFCRAFRSSVGLPPHQWILMTRCRKAKELLLDQDRSLVDIALDVGFSDQAHFTRAFGRIMGVQPGAWRRAQAVR